MDVLLAQAAAGWSIEETEKLECCRETARTLSNFLGISDTTACLAELWLVITKAQCRVSGLTGEIVTLASMGTNHVPPRPLRDIKSMNPYMVQSLRIAMPIMKEMMPKILALDKSLGSNLIDLCAQVNELL